MIRKLLLTLTMLLLQIGVSSAQQPKKIVAAVSADASGLAINGYDPVAYFVLGKATKGQPEFKSEYQGAKFLFASAEYKATFEADPGKYAPQFGGYCAWAVGNGYTAPTDPEAWKIVNGKLYLNYNKDIQKRWSSDESALIHKGEQNWPALHR